MAVELAAARTTALSPAQILERLSQRLDLLRGGRDAEARQQTLRATVEWSHELLGVEEQRLFARLAVFAGLLAVGSRDPERGRAAADELLSLGMKTDSSRATARGVNIAALVAHTRGDWDQAADLHAEVARLARGLGDSWLLSIALNNLGDVALNRGDYDRALGLFEESLALGRELQDQDFCARALLNLGLTALMLGDVERARDLLHESLVAAQEIGVVDGFIQGLAALGATYARENPTRAARLLGHADLLCEETGSSFQQFEGRVRDEAKAEIRASLGDEGYVAAYEEGGARSRSRRRSRSPCGRTEPAPGVGAAKSCL